jgi:hypothetical protein
MEWRERGIRTGFRPGIGSASDGFKKQFAAARGLRKVQLLVTNLKRILNLNRLRLREMNGAGDEFLLAAIARNLRQMAKS